VDSGWEEITTMARKKEEVQERTEERLNQGGKTE
jgi:hypothetical protein